MVHHADFSKFESNTSKQEAYEQVLESVNALVDGQDNWVANTANVSSLLWNMFKSFENSPLSKVNWAGFYVVDPKNSTQLILGPFHGQVACQIIKIGKGVCGTAASSKKTQLVKDVEEFPGHIACDGDTKSEIVVPIVDESTGQVFGVIDIDCQELAAFDEVDQKYLERLAANLVKSCAW